MVLSIGGTHAQGTAAAARATRGYQAGVHFWEVQVLILSDCSYVGLVSAEWASVHLPVGRAPESWGVASSGVVLVCGDEVSRLPLGFSEGSTIGVLLELGGPGQRTATVFVDGRRYVDLFADLPDTVYPAVSNNRAPAQYCLSCGASPPAGSSEHGLEAPVPPPPA